MTHGEKIHQTMLAMLGVVTSVQGPSQ